MRYIVKAGTGEFGGVRVLAESAGAALDIAREMIERDVRGIEIVDEEGNLLDVAEVEAIAGSEGASEAILRKEA